MIDGGCLCGRVRFRLHETPHHLCDCHCIDCRRASGAPFVTWGTVTKDKLEILSGDIRTVRHADRIRSFAGCCGTSLFFQDDDSATLTDVSIASLDDPLSFAPELAIWTEDRLPWVLLDPTKPALRQNQKE